MVLKKEVTKHLAEEELYFKRTRELLSLQLKILGDIKKEVLFLEQAGETGLRTKKVDQILTKIEVWEEQIKDGLALVLQLAGEELDEAEELPPIYTDILKFTVVAINQQEKRFSMVISRKFSFSSSDFTLKQYAEELKEIFNRVTDSLTAILHLFESAEKLVLLESKVLFRQNLGNRYLEVTIPKLVQLLQEKLVMGGLTVKFSFREESEAITIDLPLASVDHREEIFKIFEAHRSKIDLIIREALISIDSNSGEHRGIIGIRYNSPWDCFEAETNSFFKPEIFFTENYGAKKGRYISLGTFFDEFVSRKEVLISKNVGAIMLKDDYKKIISVLEHGIAPGFDAPWFGFL